MATPTTFTSPRDMSLARRYASAAYGFTWSEIGLLFGRLISTIQLPPGTNTNLSGKNVIVTGANSGIGFVLAQQLAGFGAHVFMVCRSQERGTKAMDEILAAQKDAKVSLMQLDVGNLENCRTFCKEWIASGRQIDILCHNAGIGSSGKGLHYTSEGFDPIYATNFLGSFLMTRLLEEKFTPTTRVIFTASAASYITNIPESGWSLSKVTNKIEPGFHCAAFLPATADSSYYAHTKLMQVLLGRALQRRWAGPSTSERVATSFGPGYTKSNIFEGVVRSWTDVPYQLLSRLAHVAATPTEQGTAMGIYVCLADRKTLGDHLFWEMTSPLTSHADFYSDEMVDKLWIRWSADADLDP